MSNLVCEKINKNYKDTKVLKDIDLTIEEGKIYGLIGRNGVGKTTLLSIISGQNPSSSGDVFLDGEKVWENTKSLCNICFSRELNITGDSAALGNYKIKGYLKAAAIFYPNWDGEMADRLVKDFGLDPNKRLSKLSKGMLSMLTIIIALASKAKFTFLDEPVAGLDVVARDDFYRLLIDEFSDSGRTFVISTHIIDEASDVFEEVIVMKEGGILLKENTVDLLERTIHISGEASKIDEYIKDKKAYGVHNTGRSKGCTVLLNDGELPPSDNELTVQKESLQQLFVALCGKEQ